MAKLFSSILFSFFLLFQTISIADEEAVSAEITAEENEASSGDVDDNPHKPVQKKVEPKEELSELEKEAIAAEQAELREAGVFDEPIVE